MPQNVEIKARVEDIDAVELRAAALADGAPTDLLQEDIFFETVRGRLKLRCLPDGRGELIHYERSDAAGPKTSSYSVLAVADAGPWKRMLTAALAVRGRVRKRRRLHLVGQTEIHLDRVEDLGDFVELEVVLGPEDSAARGVEIARDLMERLEIRPEQLVEGAYIDLLSG